MNTCEVVTVSDRGVEACWAVYIYSALHVAALVKRFFVAVIPQNRNFFAVLRKRQKTYYKTKFAFVLAIHNYNVYR